METIMLTGDSHKGKTAALHFVYEILVAHGAKPTNFVHVGHKTHRDFSDVLKYNEKNIKIFTAGDEEKLVKEALSSTGCHFIIYACNNKIKKIFQQASYEIEKTTAETPECMLSANWYDASRIIELLEKNIK